MTSVFLVGFFFALYWSYLLVVKAYEGENSVQRFAGGDSANGGAGLRAPAAGANFGGGG